MKKTQADRWFRRMLRAALASAFLVCPACAPSGPKLVVLLTIEGMAQRQTAGVETVSIPADLLKADPVASEPVFTPCPVLRPALTSIMTGLPPLEHGVLDNADVKLPTTLPLLAEDFKARGWTTAAFVASPLVSWLGGLERGFELFDGAEGYAFAEYLYYPQIRPGSEVVGNFVKWLETRPKDKDAFVWVHLSDLATPPTLVQGGVDSKERLARVAEIDRAVGGLRTALRDAKNQPAVLVVTSDRVVAEGIRGDLGQGFFLDPIWIQVPFATERFGLDPRWRPPARPADLTGVAAYLEGLASLRDGRLGAARGVGDGVRTVSVSKVPWFWCRWSPAVAAAQGQDLWIQDGAWRHVPAGSEAKDVGEGEVPEAVRSHVAAVLAKLAAVPARGPKTQQAVEIARAHGIEIGSDDLVAATPDLATRKELVETLERARAALVQNRPVMITRALAQLTEANPPMLAGLLDKLLYQSSPTGDRMAAVETARRILGAAGAHPIALHWLAHAAIGLNEQKLVLALLEAYLEMRPGEPDVLYDMACSKSMEGDMQTSAAYLAQAIENGFRHWNVIQNDADLRALRTDRRFGEVMKSHGR